jgi:hypothetical protein
MINEKMKNLAILTMLVSSLFACEGNKHDDLRFKEKEPILEEVQPRDPRFDYFSDYPFATQEEVLNVIKSSTRIVGYNWNGMEPNPNNPSYVASEDGILDPTIGEAIELSQDHINTLIELFSDTTNFNNESQTFFVPHLSLIMYQKTKIIGQINVCFFCAGIKAIPRFEKSFSETGFNEMEKLCKAIGLNVVKS